MKDFHFGSKDGSKLSYYVFIKASQNIGEHAFFRYDTMKEAVALFEYQRAMHPDRSLSLGVHKDFTRRADIVEQIDGLTVLSDDYKRFSPWKEDALVLASAQEAADRLEVKWKIDRRLVGYPILIPRGSSRSRTSSRGSTGRRSSSSSRRRRCRRVIWRRCCCICLPMPVNGCSSCWMKVGWRVMSRFAPSDRRRGR